jgi:hypothetical protein
MADSFTPNLNLRKPEVGAAYDTWGGVAGLNADLDLIDAIFLATGLGTSVGLHVGAAKVANIEGTLVSTGGATYQADGTDRTKVVKFDASLISTATTRTLQWPDESGVVATQVDILARVPTGTVFSGYYGGTPPPSFVMADGRTIGDATSGATNRANADTVTLFTLLWTITGLAVSGGRGASAAADYAAHKTLALPNHSGRTMAGRDDLSGTAANVWPGTTVRAAVGGATTSSSGISGTVSVSGGISGSASGSLGVSADGTAYNVDGGGGRNGSGDLVGSHSHAVHVDGSASGTLGVGGSFSGGGSITGGSTGTFNIIQPSIVVDVIIAL